MLVHVAGRSCRPISGLRLRTIDPSCDSGTATSGTPTDSLRYQLGAGNNAGLLAEPGLTPGRAPRASLAAPTRLLPPPLQTQLVTYGINYRLNNSDGFCH